MSGPLATRNEIEADYDSIQNAVMETERGRWFLAEYARRNRHADTEVLLASLSRIEKTVSAHSEASEMDRFRLNVLEMSRAIARTREEISAIQQPDSQSGLTVASGELDSIVSATEAATSEILAAAEKVQEVAWTLREAGAAADSCDMMDHHAVAIYTACSFQDLTAQRTRKVIEALAFLETRVNAMADIWQFADAAAAPVEPEAPRSSVKAAATAAFEAAMSQSDVDTVLVEEEFDQADFEQAVMGQIDLAEADSGRSDMDRSDLGMVAPVSAIMEPEAALSSIPEIGDVVALDPAPAVEAQADSNAQVDAILFEQPAPQSLPDVLPPLKLVKPDDQATAFFDKAKSGGTLSAEEAATALDALKAMSVEERTKLFS